MKRVFGHLFDPTKKLVKIDKCDYCDFKLDEFNRQLQRVKEEAVKTKCQKLGLQEEGECAEEGEYIEEKQPIVTTEKSSLEVAYEHDQLEDGEVQEEDQGCNSDTTDPEEHEMQYLTPEMIEIFRASEIFRMSKGKQETIHIDSTFLLTDFELNIDESDLYTKDLKKLLDKRFQEGNKRKPILWPIIAISF